MTDTDDTEPTGRTAPPMAGRSSKGRFARTLEGIERDIEAARLAARGWTYQRISDHLGYGSHANALRAVKKLMERKEREGSEVARGLHLDRLAELRMEAFRVLRRPHYVVSDGRVVLYTPTGGEEAPLIDSGPVLRAIREILGIDHREALLLNLYPPKRVEVAEGSMGDLDAAVRALAEELARAGHGKPVPTE